MDESPSDYLRARHARFAAPPEVIDDLVHRATGTRIDRLDRIIRGYVNEVYRARLDTGAEVSVRLRRFDNEERTPHGEAWAIERARSAGAPVPAVLLVEQLELAEGTVPAMVLEWLPGVPLASVERELTARERDATLERMGAAFAAINSVPVEGLWLPPTDGAWAEMTSVRIARGYLAELDGQQTDAYAAGLTTVEFERTLDLIRHSAEDFPCEQPVLCHNDMSPEHVLVDADLAITGVIDFGAWCGASDVGDLGHLRFARSDIPLTPVLRGYGSPQHTDPTLLTRIGLQALSQAIGHLTHEVRENDREQAARSLATLRSLLRSLRDYRPGADSATAR